MQLVPFGKRQDNKPVTLRDAMNRLFDESFWDPFDMFGDRSLFPNTFQGRITTQFIPNIDISETDKEVKVVTDLPGYEPEKIDVQLQDGVLTMSGSMQEEKEEKDKKEKWYRKECSSGSFYRQFTLPDYIEEDKVKCKFKNGKLTIIVPKKAEAETVKQGKKLEIEVG